MNFLVLKWFQVIVATIGHDLYETYSVHPGLPGENRAPIGEIIHFAPATRKTNQKKQDTNSKTQSGFRMAFLPKTNENRRVVAISFEVLDAPAMANL